MTRTWIDWRVVSHKTWRMLIQEFFSKLLMNVLDRFVSWRQVQNTKLCQATALLVKLALAYKDSKNSRNSVLKSHEIICKPRDLHGTNVKQNLDPPSQSPPVSLDQDTAGKDDESNEWFVTRRILDEFFHTMTSTWHTLRQTNIYGWWMFHDSPLRC